ncbi:MAG: methyltransferase domain-containing protein [Anaerolineae bacterium]|jgi:SAM-dependent methyltransferase
MDHSDHVNLLRGGIPDPGGVWADLGSGTGAFTLALAELIGPNGQIHSVDKRRDALQRQEQAMRARFPKMTVHYRIDDFARRLDLPPLDGIVMANSLHFQPEKDPVVRLVRSYLRPGGRLIVVEYETDRGNPWVPHPFSYRRWEKVARRNGLVDTTLLMTRPSRFLGQIYSAVSYVPQTPAALRGEAVHSGGDEGEVKV